MKDILGVSSPDSETWESMSGYERFLVCSYILRSLMYNQNVIADDIAELCLKMEAIYEAARGREKGD